MSDESDLVSVLLRVHGVAQQLLSEVRRAFGAEVMRRVWVTGAVVTVWYSDLQNADWADLVERVIAGGWDVKGAMNGNRLSV